MPAHKGFTLISRSERAFSAKREALGFTLIELLVAVAIVAILSAIGFTIFSNAGTKARDTSRKNDLKQIQTAIEVYYENKGQYPVGDNATCVAIDDSFNEKINNYLKDIPQDPRSNEGHVGYCYLSNQEGNRYTLFAKLENCDEANINQDKCDDETSYTYALSSEDIYINQTLAIPTPDSFTNISLPVPTFRPFNRSAANTVNLCNGFTTGQRTAPSCDENCSESDVPYYPISPRLNSWSNVSKVKVYYYKFPKPLAPPNTPFVDSNWVSIGEVTANNQQLNFADPGPGNWYLGMDVYNSSGQIVDARGTGTSTRCTQPINIQPLTSSICETDIATYPKNLKANVVGNNLLLTWDVNNDDHNNNNFEVYKSDFPGFTAAPTNQVSMRFQPSNNIIVDRYNGNEFPAGSYFYKIAAFNSANSTSFNQQIAANVPKEKDSCSNTHSPPTPTNLTVSNNGNFTWKYSYFLNDLDGWYLESSNGLRIDLAEADVETNSNCNSGNNVICASWQMPYPISGSYTIRSYGGDCGNLLSSSSNIATLTTNNTQTSAPPTGNVELTSATVHRLKQHIIVGFNDNTNNSAGFRIYRSNTPLDLTKSTKTGDIDNTYRSSFVQNLPNGTHYFAVKATNQCGEGWSNYIPINIPNGSVQGISTQSVLQKIKDFLF